MKDKVQVTDFIMGGTTRIASPAKWPCEKCSKETKVDPEEGWRICSNRACRNRQRYSGE